MAKQSIPQKRVAFRKQTSQTGSGNWFALRFADNPREVILIVRPGHKKQDSVALRKEYKARGGKPKTISTWAGDGSKKQTGTLCIIEGETPFYLVAGRNRGGYRKPTEASAVTII